MLNIKFEAGAHSAVEFQERVIKPLFANGTITEHPGAEYYAVCYGELCAYGGGKLLAIWTATVPDCDSDVDPNATYEGTWAAP